MKSQAQQQAPVATGARKGSDQIPGAHWLSSLKGLRERRSRVVEDRHLLSTCGMAHVCMCTCVCRGRGRMVRSQPPKWQCHSQCLGSARAGLRRIAGGRMEVDIQHSSGKCLPGSTLSSLPLANGTRSSLLAHTCNTLQSSKLTSRFLFPY